MSMTTVANPRTPGPPRKPQPHQPRTTNQTMAINPYPLTSTPPYGRHCARPDPAVRAPHLAIEFAQMRAPEFGPHNAPPRDDWHASPRPLRHLRIRVRRAASSCRSSREGQGGRSLAGSAPLLPAVDAAALAVGEDRHGRTNGPPVEVVMLPLAVTRGTKGRQPSRTGYTRYKNVYIADGPLWTQSARQ